MFVLVFGVQYLNVLNLVYVTEENEIRVYLPSSVFVRSYGKSEIVKRFYFKRKCR